MYGIGYYGKFDYGDTAQMEVNPEECYIDLIHYLPDVYKNVKQIKNLQKVLGYEVGKLAYDEKNLLNQCFVSTATVTLDQFEKEYGIETDYSKSYALRRKVIQAKMQGTGTITKKMLADVVNAFVGGEVAILEHPKESAFTVQIIGIKGIPPNLATLMDMIDEIKPAHLSYQFMYTYTTWQELTLEWGNAKTKTWSDLKVYEGGTHETNSEL